MPTLPSIRSNIKKHKLTSGAAWLDRMMMWTAATIAGLCVVGFTFLSDAAVDLFTAVRATSIWLPLILTPLGAVIVVWATRRFAPGAAGSGIPQVIAGMDTSLPPSQTRHFISLKLSAAKAFLGALALAAGFSTGREGVVSENGK